MDDKPLLRVDIVVGKQFTQRTKMSPDINFVNTMEVFIVTICQSETVLTFFKLYHISSK